MVLLAGTTMNIHAQTPTPAVPGAITLGNLGKTDVSLTGPFDSTTVTFGLPAEWKFTGDAKLDLSITTVLNAVGITDVQPYGGTLQVSFNQVHVATLTLNKSETASEPITIPAAQLVSARADGLMELKFTLNSGISCLANQHMNVVVNPTTQITFQYEEQKPSTSLLNFPRPIIQSTIYADTALVVIPDKPTAMELQSAMTVIAGLGNLSASTLGLDLVSVSKLTTEQKAGTNLIYVGKAASLTALADFDLPLKVQSGAFKFSDGGQDNGVVEMINSPASVRNVILVVSGNTDAGTVKAAQAVSTGVFQQNTAPNLAIVEKIQDANATADTVTDQSFADLGYAERQFSTRGVNSSTYVFDIPSGKTLTTDAYLELAFAHSALLDYTSSGIVVLLNGQPIGSVRMSDVSAAQAINRVKIPIPPTVAIPGSNRIEVRANLEPLSNCTDPNSRSLFIEIWPDSQFHLPFTATALNTQSIADLKAYPEPMIFDSTLATTAVIFQKNDYESWRAFAQVASYLGDRSNGSIYKLAVFFDDDLAAADLSKYNLIVVGQPSKSAIMEKLNSTLPVPFIAGSDITQTKFLQVTYQVPASVPVGYVELMPSPWNKEKVLIGAFGNKLAGVNWSISALVSAPLRSQLAGDFAVINETQVQTVDSRIVVPVANNTPVVEAVATALATPQPQAAPVPTTSRTPWLVPGLVLAIIAIVLVLVIAIVSNLRNSMRKK
jgi:hypothetical protein